MARRLRLRGQETAPAVASPLAKPQEAAAAAGAAYLLTKWLAGTLNDYGLL